MKPQTIEGTPAPIEGPSIDLWAFLAIIRFQLSMWVVFAHTYNFGDETLSLPVPSRNALVAVYCFFAISGFSIHSSITRHDTTKQYLLNRVRRILPIHITSIILALSTYMICGSMIHYGPHYEAPCPFPSLYDWIVCIFLLQALLPITVTVLFPTWSLAIEVVYYLSAPFLRRLPPLFPIGLALLSGITFAWYMHKYPNTYIATADHLKCAFCMMWAWLAGWVAYNHQRNLSLCLVFSLAGIISIFLDNLLSGYFNYAAWVSVLTLQFYGAPLRITQTLRALANYLGDLSFPIYLLNYPVFFLLCNTVFKKHPHWHHGIIMTLVLILVSMCTYHLIDKPFRTKKSKLIPSPRWEVSPLTSP